MNRLQSILKICVIAMLVLTGCHTTEQKTEINYQQSVLISESESLKEEQTFKLSEVLDENGEVSADEDIDKIPDYTYKMWYGKWKVDKNVGITYKTSSAPYNIYPDVSDVIGKTYSFSEEKALLYCRGQEIEIEAPYYTVRVIPLEEDTTYLPYVEPTFVELGVTGAYIALFTVSDSGGDMYFFLKDDESMIMFYDYYLFELKRIEHEEGHEFFYSI